MELTGEILGIIYQNELNSYTVAELYVEEISKSKTIVGYMPFIKVGDNIKVFGNYVEHRDYGQQFKVETFEKIMPQTLDALERYLGNGTIKGVRQATAKKIVSEFKEDTINIIKNEPMKLTKIKGISKDKALSISESFIESQEVWKIVSFLEKFNIGIENSKKIYDSLGISAIDQIEKNPYILVDLVRGIDFKQIDSMALSMGIDSSSEVRIMYGIKYGLILATYNGHSCTLFENLVEFVINLLDVTRDETEDALIRLKVKGEICLETRTDDTEWVYLENFYNTEVDISNRIINLDNSTNMKKIKGIEDEIKKVETYNSIKLSEKQKEAIKAVNKHNVTIITGGPRNR